MSIEIVAIFQKSSRNDAMQVSCIYFDNDLNNMKIYNIHDLLSLVSKSFPDIYKKNKYGLH